MRVPSGESAGGFLGISEQHVARDQVRRHRSVAFGARVRVGPSLRARPSVECEPQRRGEVAAPAGGAITGEAEFGRFGGAAQRLRDARTSPDRPSSPNAIVPAASGTSRNADAIASAMPKSAPVSADAQPAGDRAVDVVAAELQAGAALEDRDDHRQPRGVDVGGQPPRRTVRCLADQRLNLDEHRAHRPTSVGTTHVPLGAFAALVQEQRRRIGDLVQPAIVHREDADLVGPAEAVLVGAHDAVLARLVAFEVQDGVDEVLEQPRPGDRAVLRDVPDDERRAARCAWRTPSALACSRALRDAAGERLDVGQPHRLDRVDDEDVGDVAFEPSRTARRFVSANTSSVSLGADALRAQLRLRRRLFAADVDACAPRRGERVASCSSKVDLPAPGGPPSNTRLPGTIPPPSSASNSGIPVRRRSDARVVDRLSARPVPRAQRRAEADRAAALFAGLTTGGFGTCSTPRTTGSARASAPTRNRTRRNSKPIWPSPQCCAPCANATIFGWHCATRAWAVRGERAVPACRTTTLRLTAGCERQDDDLAEACRRDRPAVSRHRRDVPRRRATSRCATVSISTTSGVSSRCSRSTRSRSSPTPQRAGRLSRGDRWPRTSATGSSIPTSRRGLDGRGAAGRSAPSSSNASARSRRQGPVVMAGRDIGTVVLPDARHKFFLTASVDERARRRQAEFPNADSTLRFLTCAQQIVERDRLDSTRAVSPLRAAADAITIDSTDLAAGRRRGAMRAAMDAPRVTFYAFAKGVVGGLVAAAALRYRVVGARTFRRPGASSSPPTTSRTSTRRCWGSPHSRDRSRTWRRRICSRSRCSGR
jgi:hypothetical protein